MGLDDYRSDDDYGGSSVEALLLSYLKFSCARVVEEALGNCFRVLNCCSVDTQVSLTIVETNYYAIVVIVKVNANHTFHSDSNHDENSNVSKMMIEAQVYA